jgi:hypothetical protein
VQPADLLGVTGERFDNLAGRVGEDDLAAGHQQVLDPSQRSEMTGTPHAPASNRRTEGDQPAAIMSARVTFSVKRDAE